MKEKKFFLLIFYTTLSNIFYLLLAKVHIDDVIFLNFSKKILRGNLNPLSLPYIWNGKIWPDMLSYSHPPLIYYYMALLLKISKKIVFLHMGFLIFPIITAISIYYLLKKYSCNYFFYSLLFITLPLITFTSHTLMMDMPSFSFILAGITLIEYGISEEDKLKVIAGSIIGGLSILISINSILFIPLVILQTFTRKRGKKFIFLASLPPVVIFLSWTLFIYHISGRFFLRDIYLLLSSMKKHSYNLFSKKLFYFFISVGFLSLFSPFFLLFSKKTFSKKIIFISFLISFIFSGYFLKDYRLAGRFILLFIFFSTLNMFYLFIVEKTQEELIFFKIWILFFIFYETLISPHGASRYYLLILPPIFLIFLNLKDRKRIKVGKKLEVIFFLTIILISSIVNVGDIIFESGYKKGAEEIVKKFQHKKIWYACHWELGYYLEEKGASEILRYDRRVKKGDILIKTYVSPTYETKYEKPPYGKKIGEINIYPQLPIYVMNQELKCGLYSDYWGLYPFKIYSKKIPEEKITIYKILNVLPEDKNSEKMNYGFFVKNGKMTLHFY